MYTQIWEKNQTIFVSITEDLLAKIVKTKTAIKAYLDYILYNL